MNVSSVVTALFSIEPIGVSENDGGCDETG